MDTKTKEILEDVKDRLREANDHANIANSERLLSVAAGAFVLYTGITRAKEALLLQGSKATILKAAAEQVKRTSGIIERFPGG